MRRETLTKAEDAAAILSNETFMALLDDLDASIISQWRAEQDISAREDLFYRQQALSAVRGSLVDCISRAADEDARAGTRQGPWRALWLKLTA